MRNVNITRQKWQGIWKYDGKNNFPQLLSCIVFEMSYTSRLFTTTVTTTTITATNWKHFDLFVRCIILCGVCLKQIGQKNWPTSLALQDPRKQSGGSLHPCMPTVDSMQRTHHLSCIICECQVGCILCLVWQTTAVTLGVPAESKSISQTHRWTISIGYLIKLTVIKFTVSLKVTQLLITMHYVYTIIKKDANINWRSARLKFKRIVMDDMTNVPRA